MTRLDPALVQHQIANLVAAYPDLADDDDGWSLAISSETELDEMLIKLVRLIDDSKALVDGTKARADELDARVTRFKRRIEAYRSLIQRLMDAANLPKRELPEATLSIRAGSPRVIITDERLIPPSLTVIKTEPNKTLIRTTLTAGGSVPGAVLSNAEPSLTIRVK